MSAFEKVYEIVKKIPEGRVATYGQIARLLGNPRYSRVIGYALHVNPSPDTIPCFRVVNRDGRTSPAFAFGGQDVQKELLLSEGVEFLPNGNVDLSRFLWDGEM